MVEDNPDFWGPKAAEVEEVRKKCKKMLKDQGLAETELSDNDSDGSPKFFEELKAEPSEKSEPVKEVKAETIKEAVPETIINLEVKPLSAAKTEEKP